MRKLAVIYILCLFVDCPILAQKATFEFFTTADGLAGNNTSSVTQDDQGFIWLVNEGKLLRYDGRNFVVYPSPKELVSGQEPLSGLVSCQDSLLFIWSEHFSFLFNPKTGNWQRIELNEKKTESNETRFWSGLGNDIILMNRARKGYQSSDLSGFQATQFKPIRLSKYAPLLNAYHWNGVNAFDNTIIYSDTLYQLDKSGRTKMITPLGNICTICTDLWFQVAPDGTVFLLADERFYRLDKRKNKFVPHPLNRFLQNVRDKLIQFIPEKNGNVWICGRNRSLLYYDAVKDILYNFQDELKQLLPNRNDFIGLFQDKTGVVWVNTRFGMLKVKPKSSPFDTYFSGLSPANHYYSFRGFTEDSQGILYGMYYDGIVKFDPSGKQSERFYTFNKILNFFDLSAEGDNVWVNGGQLLDSKSGKLTNVSSLLYKNPLSDNGFFAKEKNGTLWWASHYFLYRLEKVGTGFQWILELEFSEKVLNKTEALHLGRKSGKFWLSFNGKLLRYDPKTKQQRWFIPKQWGLPVSRITTIEEDDKGKLWLGTDNGLVYVDPAGGIKNHYTVTDGLPNNFICGLLTEGDSCLWLSTNHGLSRFHIPTQTFINFFEEDGLTYNEFNRKSYFKARNGRMFFGGMKGVNAFFPQEVMKAYRNKSRGSNLVLASIEYTDERRDTVLRQTNFTDYPEIHFNYWDWSYTFEYALTDYHNPKEIAYSYKMEGYKDSWSAPSKFNFTRFNSLPSGHYIFRVRARDSRGQWHPNELAVKVVVFPPWWATWWAYFTYFLLISGIVYIIYSFLRRRLLLRNELQLKQKEAHQLKELDQVKTQLYTNLTHEFRTPLTIILGMIEQIRDQPNKYLEEGTHLIQTNGKNLLRLINQLLDLSKLENKSLRLIFRQDDIVPYLRYITESFQSYANSRNLSIRFFTALESQVMDYDAEQLKQVLTNLISNAIKFTPSGGDIMVRLTEIEGQLNIEIRDTGIGIAQNELPYIFDRFYQADSTHTRQSEGTGIGLAHTQELVKLMGGSVSVKSEPGNGTTFLVRLPIATNALISEEGTVRYDIIPNQTRIVSEPIHNSSIIANYSVLPQLLLIEDNPDVVIYLKSCLEGLYQLDVAYNGKIGIEKALENIPDIIISDVMMPEKDGYQVCDALKNDERTSHIPIILLTAKAGLNSKLTGLKRGADAYLIKPFDKQELLLQLEVLVEKQKRLIAYFSKINLLKELVPAPEPQLEEAFAVEDAFVKKVREIIAENFANEEFGLPQLCLKIGMSRSQLFRKMKALMDTTPSDFIRSYRLAQAKVLLETGAFTVSEVAWQTGYKNPGHFSTSFQEEFGFSPSEIRK